MYLSGVLFYFLHSKKNKTEVKQVAKKSALVCI